MVFVLTEGKGIVAYAMPFRLGEKGYWRNRNGLCVLALVEAGQHREEGAGGESGTQQQRDGADGVDAGDTPGEAQRGGSDEADKSGDNEVVVFHNCFSFRSLRWVAFFLIVWYHGLVYL